VSAGGEAGLDWANIGSPTTAVNLSGTNIDVDQVVASVSGAVASVTATVSANVVQISGDSAAADMLENLTDGTGGTISGNLSGNVTGNVNGSIGSVATGGITSGSFAADAITAAKLHADVTAELQSGLATAANLATVAGYLDTEVAAIKAVTDKLDTAVELDGAVYRYTTNALEQAPSGGGGLTVQDIVDGVWDEPMADHLDSGSTGASLNGAGSAGDPWTTTLPGAYGAGTAGKILGDNLNATVSSRATQSSVDAIDDFLDTEVAAIKAKTDNLPSDPADASDVLAATTTIAGYIDTEVAAIKAKTDNLPSDPADASDVLAATTTIAGYLDTEIAAIKAKTDNLPSDPADASDIAAAFTTVNTKLDTIDDLLDTEVAAIVSALAALPTANANADALLDRSNGIETGLTLRQALRLISAASAGKLSGAATTTVTIRNVGDTKNRITATVDADGNRSAVTTDAT
jgi:ActR/RegA family two-component response regulator